MVDPSPLDTILAGIEFLIMAGIIVMLITGLAHRLRDIGQRLTNSNAKVDAKILMAENVYVTTDPTGPDAEYAATKAVSQVLKKGR